MLMTQRIANSEDKMFEVLNYIKDHDLSFVNYQFVIIIIVLETLTD